MNEEHTTKLKQSLEQSRREDRRKLFKFITSPTKGIGEKRQAMRAFRKKYPTPSPYKSLQPVPDPQPLEKAFDGGLPMYN